MFKRRIAAITAAIVMVTCSLSFAAGETKDAKAAAPASSQAPTKAAAAPASTPAPAQTAAPAPAQAAAPAPAKAAAPASSQAPTKAAAPASSQAPTKAAVSAKAAAPATTPAKAGEPIKIGAIFAVTGPASFLGAPEEKTANMLVDEINAKGGIKGQKLVLLIKDSQGSPEKAVSFAKQLIEEEKVFAIIGPSTSGETMQIKALCDQSKTILISCAAAEVIVNPLAKYVFKTPQKDSDAARKIFMVLQKLKIDKIAVTSSNTGFGKAGKEQLEKIAPEYKVQVVISEVYEKDATDLTGVLTKIKAANVGAIVNWSIEPAQAILAKNMKQLGFKIPLFQSHGFGNIKYVQAAGEAADGIIFPAGRLLIAGVLAKDHPQKALLEKYKADYETKYKEDVSTFGGHAYDAIMVLAKAIEIAGADKEKVCLAIEGLKGLVGTAGVFNFSATDHNGLDINAFEMLTVKAGKFVVYTGN